MFQGVCWDFYLMRQHGLVPTTCAKAFISYALQSLLSCSSGQCIWDKCFSYTPYAFKQVLYFNFLLPCFLTPSSFKLWVLDCTDCGLENLKITEYTKAITWLWSHHQVNITFFF